MLGQAELGEDLVHPGAALLLGGVRRETQLGAVLQGTADAERGVKQVLLGDVTDAAAQLVVLGVHVPTGVTHRALVRGAETGEGVEQGGLARATGSDHRQQCPAGQPEGHVVHELLLASPHVQAVGLEADVPGVDVLDEFVLDALEDVVTDSDDRALRHRLADDALAVDERPVGRLEVGDLHIPAGAQVDLGVLPGGQQVAHDDVVVPGTADGHPARAQPVGGLALVLTLKIVAARLGLVARRLPRQLRAGLVADGATQHRRHLEVRVLVTRGVGVADGNLQQDDDLRPGRGTEPEPDLAVDVDALYPLTVEPGSVRADVPDSPARADRLDQQVPAGDPAVRHHEIGRARAADNERLTSRHGGHVGTADDSQGRLHVFPPSATQER